MSKHTAGPWSTDADHPSTWHPKVYAETDSFIGPLCEMYSNLSLPGTDPRLREEMGANARLIAAAPDLLEALQETDKDLAVLVGNIAASERVDSRWEGMVDVVNAWRERNRAAVAKATGEAQ